MKAGKTFFILLLVFLSGCTKNNSQDPIPNVYVNIDLYLSDPSNVKLNAIGGWVYVTGGVRGVIVYRKSNDEFIALERNCPYQPKESCATVSVDASNILAVDTCCGSKFQLMDGSIVNGPATYPLKRYLTTLSNNTLHISN